MGIGIIEDCHEWESESSRSSRMGIGIGIVANGNHRDLQLQVWRLWFGIGGAKIKRLLGVEIKKRSYKMKGGK